jgi:hypothetical protein
MGLLYVLLGAAGFLMQPDCERKPPLARGGAEASAEAERFLNRGSAAQPPQKDLLSFVKREKQKTE